MYIFQQYLSYQWLKFNDLNSSKDTDQQIGLENKILLSDASKKHILLPKINTVLGWNDRKIFQANKLRNK